MSEGGPGRDELLDGFLPEGEGDVRNGVHDLRHLPGERQRQHGVQSLQEHSGDNQYDFLAPTEAQGMLMSVRPCV